MSIEFIFLIIGAYLLGSVPFAYLVAKWSRGIDIRQYGSGNIGATNVIGVTSKWLGILVTILDLGKGMVMVGVAYLVGLDITQQVIIGLAAIIGHNWSVFLRFSGGRGVLTTLGIVLILPVINNLVPWEIVVFLAIMAVAWLIIHNIPLGIAAGIAALPLVSWGFSEPLPLTLGYLAMFLLLVIKRLVARQATGAIPISRTQLLLNRLLFDRDIRDRKAWIHRTPKNSSSK